MEGKEAYRLFFFQVQPQRNTKTSHRIARTLAHGFAKTFFRNYTPRLCHCPVGRLTLGSDPCRCARKPVYEGVPKGSSVKAGGQSKVAKESMVSKKLGLCA